MPRAATILIPVLTRLLTDSEDLAQARPCRRSASTPVRKLNLALCVPTSKPVSTMMQAWRFRHRRRRRLRLLAISPKHWLMATSNSAASASVADELVSSTHGPVMLATSSTTTSSTTSRGTYATRLATPSRAAMASPLLIGAEQGWMTSPFSVATMSSKTTCRTFLLVLKFAAGLGRRSPVLLAMTLQRRRIRWQAAFGREVQRHDSLPSSWAAISLTSNEGR